MGPEDCILHNERCKQSIRVYAQIAGLVVLLSTAPWLIDHYGLAGMLVTMQITLLTLFIIYFLALMFKRLHSGFSTSGVLVNAGVFSAAILLLKYPGIRD